MNNSESIAWKIIEKYVELVKNNLSDKVEAVILIGSLAIGSYIEGPGDIDQITILKDSEGNTHKNTALKYMEESMMFFDNSVNMSKNVFFLSELKKPWKQDISIDKVEDRYIIEIPVELQRIHEHGKVLLGREDMIKKLPKPDIQDMINYSIKRRELNEESLKKFPVPNHKKIMSNPTLRVSVQTILCKAIEQYFLLTESSCSNKHIINDKMREAVNYRFQRYLDIAVKVRKSKFENVSLEDEEVLKEGFSLILKWSKENCLKEISIDTYRKNLLI